MLLATTGAVSTLLLCESAPLHQSEYMQQNSESFASFAIHTLKNHIRELLESTLDVTKSQMALSVVPNKSKIMHK